MIWSWAVTKQLKNGLVKMRQKIQLIVITLRTVEEPRGELLFIAVECGKLMNFPDVDKSDSEDESSFNMINPDLIDFNVVSNGVWNFISVSSVLLQVYYYNQSSFVLWALSTEWCS